jgi:hypothetical protein
MKSFKNKKSEITIARIASSSVRLVIQPMTFSAVNEYRRAQQYCLFSYLPKHFPSRDSPF